METKALTRTCGDLLSLGAGAPRRQQLLAETKRQIGKLKRAGIFIQAYGREAETLSFLDQGLVDDLIDRKVSACGQQIIDITMRQTSSDRQTFIRIFRHALAKIEKYGQDFQGVVVDQQSPGRLRVVAQTLSGQKAVSHEAGDSSVKSLQIQLGVARERARESTKQLEALSAIRQAIEGAETEQEVESAFAQILLTRFAAVRAKIYSVDSEGTVYPLRAYVHGPGRLQRQLPGEGFESHFIGGLSPEKYRTEIMGYILAQEGESAFVVPDPASDSRCKSYQTGPFIAFKETIDGRVRRVYILELGDQSVIANPKSTVDFIKLLHGEVLRAKRQLLRRRAEKIIAKIHANIQRRSGPRRVIASLLSPEAGLPALFWADVYSCDKITVLGSSPRGVVVAGEWFAPGIEPSEKEIRIGGVIPDDIDGLPTVAWTIAHLGQPIIMHSQQDFSRRTDTAWTRGGQGSLLGLPITRGQGTKRAEVLGGIVFRSSFQDAFTSPLAQALAKVCRLLSLALPESQRIKEKDTLDEKFGIVYSGGHLEHELLPSAVEEAKANNQPLSEVFMDFDHFKGLNGIFGNPKVDRWILRRVVELFGRIARRDDSMARQEETSSGEMQEEVARQGGDEFVLLCRGTSLKGAIKAAHRFQAALAKEPIIVEEEFADGSKALARKQEIESEEHPSISAVVVEEKESGGYVVKSTISLTLSVGVAELRQSDSHTDLHDRATEAQLLAKERGRNCVCDERQLS